LRLRALQRQSYTHYFYEATVGAGLPIIGTLRGLLETGDKILQIEGIFRFTSKLFFFLHLSFLWIRLHISDLEISDLALSPTVYPHFSLVQGTNKLKVPIQGLSLSVSFVHLILCFQTEGITSDFSVGL
jgi:hypothetical protein